MVDRNNVRIINSVQRAIDILGLFNNQTHSLKITEIAHLMHLPKSTAAGLVYTLIQNQYIDQDPETKKYRLGLRLAERGEVALDSIEISQIALPYLYRLQETYNENMFIAVSRGFEVIVVRRLWGSSRLRVYTAIGERIELIHTATGAAFLAALPLERAKTVLDQYYMIYPEKFDRDKHNHFLDEIEKTRHRGYSVNLKGKTPGVCYVGAAIRDHKNYPVGIIVVSVPSVRLNLHQLPKLGELLCNTALAISTKIGYQV
jgi:IclR family KDG regulon transcriptional repressor